MISLKNVIRSFPNLAFCVHDRHNGIESLLEPLNILVKTVTYSVIKA